MRKVKCAFCGKQLPLNEAYAVKHGKRNKYYCSYEHSILKTPKELFYQKAFEVFGRTTNTTFYKEFNEIADVHGYEKMTAYLEENKTYLDQTMSKTFSSEYARIRYFSAIFRNSLGDYVFNKKQGEDVKVLTDVEIVEVVCKKKKERKGLNDILDEILSD